ncbi:MAG: hypothetical protein JWN71_3642 [Xanthobacteraceae bacterium]|nr:hypothetical protein [Xanthobacteraceae bacterium]
MLRPVLFAVVLIASAGPATALDQRQLAGWWIAIDDTFPELWAKRGVAAMEEILVVGQDGRVENRAMNFTAGSAKVCAETRVCGDAPLIATARAQLKGDKLSFGERRDGATVDARGNALVRKTAITATPMWSVAQKGDQITLRSGGIVRTLARIDPDRLRRLRAGLRASTLPPARHWRCFLANATARDAAFAPLRRSSAAAPDFVPRYLHIASYLAAIDAMLAVPTADDPDARALIGFSPETLMFEHFEDVREPGSLADKKALHARMVYLERRWRGETPEAAQAEAAKFSNGAPVQAAVGAAEIAALSKVLSDDPEAKKLFCRD